MTSSERQICKVPSTAMAEVPLSQPEVPPPPKASVPAEIEVAPVKVEVAERASSPSPALVNAPPPEMTPP